MTGNERRQEALAGPPWSVDLLADLHAEALDPDLAAELWPKVEADEEASAVIAALEATRADLAGLPALKMPDDVAARIEEALAAEARAMLPDPRQETATPAPRPATPVQAPVAPVSSLPAASTPGTSAQAGWPAEGRPPAAVVDLAQARRRRNRWLGLGGGLVAAAAVAAGVLVATLPGNNVANPPVAQSQASTPAPGDTGQAPPLALRGEELPGRAPELIGATNYGPLSNEEGLNACLEASGKQPTGKPLGIQQVTVDGQPSVVAVLPGGSTPGRFRLVVMEPTCGPGRPGVRSDQLIGG